MAIVFVKQKNEQKRLIIVFLIVLAVTAVVVWFGFFKKEGAPGPDVGSVFIPKNINIDFSFIERQDFKSLYPFSQIEPFKAGLGEKVGRDNPFLAY